MKKTAKRLLFGLCFLHFFTLRAFAADMLVPVGQVIGLELYHNTVTVVAFDDHIQTGRDAGLQIGDEICKIDDCKMLAFAGIHILSDKVFGYMDEYIKEKGLPVDETVGTRFPIVDFYLWLCSQAPVYGGQVKDIAVQQTYWKRFVKRNSLFNIDADATYTPKNNKLLTYPFKYGMYGTLSGERMEYRYELLPSSIISYADNVTDSDTSNYGLRFSVLSCILPSPMALCVARNYYCNNLGYHYGMNQDSALYDERSYEFGVSLNEFPTIPTTIDGYNKYLAETSSSYNMGVLKSLLSLVSSGSDVKSVVNIDNVGAMAYQTAMAEVSVGLSYLERQTNAVLNPNYAIGVFSAPNLIMSAGYSGFYFWDYGVDIESAKVIDGYFTRYGYKLNANITPSRNNNEKRKNFTFIKTVECNIEIVNHTETVDNIQIVRNNMMQDDERAIEAIYNRGVRFWYGKNANNVRLYKDYSVDNPIVQTVS